jgi:hypothetical protein
VRKIRTSLGKNRKFLEKLGKFLGQKIRKLRKILRRRTEIFDQKIIFLGRDF